MPPGTPEIYRREALTKLLTVGYNVERNLLFGTDNHADGFNVGWAQQWIDRDLAIYHELGLSRRCHLPHLQPEPAALRGARGISGADGEDTGNTYLKD